MSNEQLTEQFLPMAHSLARRIRWHPDDHPDLVQEGLLGLYVAAQKVEQGSATPPEVLPVWASTVMRNRMTKYYKTSARYLHNEHTQELHEDHHAVFRGERYYFEEILVREFLSEVERFWGSTARDVVLDLMAPSAEVGRIALDESTTARRVTKRTGRDLRYTETVRPVKRHIWIAQGMTKNDFFSLMRDIRAFAATFFFDRPAYA